MKDIENKYMEKENQKNKSENAQTEERILEFWKENKIFEKSLKKESPKGNFVFYDGPPFATGLPHYGHILGSTAKDVIGRYQTMRGFHVPRRWGWDCHGLPIENIVEKDLGISGKKAIEELGIEKFTEHARGKVLTYVSEWEKTVDRIGRWVDFDNSYKTMDNTFIESVWWALGEMNNKGLLYEGVRVLAYCPRCETPIANSEIAMDNSYKDITDISVYVKFKLIDEENTYLLAWTTTPWTLPGNTAIAINKEFIYVFVKNQIENGEEILILAKDLFEKLKDKFKNPEIIKEVKGSELVGRSYEPVFDYYKEYFREQNKGNIRSDEHPFGRVWKVWHADFVTADQGTGIAHEAPAFGEDDMELAKDHNIPFIRHVEPNGVFTQEVTDFQNVKAKPKEDPQSTDVLIIKYLANKKTLFAKEKIIHSYPHCYRCDTPLLYYALPSWFVNIQKIKKEALENAKTMNWIPAHLKEGRFKNIMESAPDWTISRNRYWASPLPFWKSEDGKLITINSIEDLKKHTQKSGNKYFVMRHGETENNLNGTVSCVIDRKIHLTENGIKQIEKNISELKKNKIDIIISSPFDRTKQSAEIVSNSLGISKENIIFDERLIEMQVLSYDGQTWTDYHKDFPKTEEYFNKAKDGDESYQDVKNRIMEALYEFESFYKNKNILIITHGGPAWLMFAGAKGLNKKESLDLIIDKKDFHYLENADIKELDFVPIPHNDNYELDLHRPYVDKIILVDDKGIEYKRIPEVIDCWFESGSMPFAQDHYPFDYAQGKPFEHKDWQKENFPAGFVAEYIAQTRTWFYYTHIISSILFDHAPFKNIVTTGTILAEDGSKMSKSKNNFPDPWILFDKYGVDALRFYLMVSPLMKGEDINFSEKAVQEITNKIINRLNNVVSFYNLYSGKENSIEERNDKPTNVLDQWILSRFNQFSIQVSEKMEVYDMALAAKPFELFIEDLSTWYLRRSRDRLKEGDKEALTTLYFILKNLVKIMAPFTPFTAEDIYQKLKKEGEEESVHLCIWPELNREVDFKVLVEMEKVRELVTLGLEARQKVSIKVRQPLSKITIKSKEFSIDYQEILKDELNIKEIVFDENIEEEVLLDLNINEDLKQEGNYRDLLRAVQEKRKNLGLEPSDMVSISIEANNEGEELVNKFKDDFSKVAGLSEIKFEKNEGEELKIENLIFKINILK